MSLAETYGPYLPYLRRYARALTGSQKSGDSYVRACLESLVDAPELIDTALPPKLALYQLFHSIWETTGAELEGQRTQENPSVRTLPPLGRQAYLLTTLEGLSQAEAAEVLRCTEDEVSTYVTQSLDMLEKAQKARILIVEDEPVIAAELEEIVGDLGHEVVGTATTRSEAVDLAGKHRPSLILCDVQLADKSSGIDAAKDILADHALPMIFITAFPERLLTGEGVEPTFLVSKPYTEDTVRAAIGQALFFDHPAIITS